MSLRIPMLPEEELYQMYRIEKMSQAEIAELVSVAPITISNWMKKYGILTRTKSEELVLRHDKNSFVISKEELYKMYWIEEMSPAEIGKEIGASIDIVHNRMKTYSIPLRTVSEASLLSAPKGPNHPNWNGGPKKYCYKFNDRLKEAVRERDDFTCQVCGHEQKHNGEKLSVHHIHYDAENCYPDLICLCRPCHTSSGARRDEWEKLCMDILAERGLLNWNPPWIE